MALNNISSREAMELDREHPTGFPEYGTIKSKYPKLIRRIVNLISNHMHDFKDGQIQSDSGKIIIVMSCSCGENHHIRLRSPLPTGSYYYTNLGE